jgi:hypothetical protein
VRAFGADDDAYSSLLRAGGILGFAPRQTLRKEFLGRTLRSFDW